MIDPSKRGPCRASLPAMTGDALRAAIHAGVVLAFEPSPASNALVLAVKKVICGQFGSVELLRHAYSQRVLEPWRRVAATELRPASGHDGLPSRAAPRRGEALAPSSTDAFARYFAQLSATRQALLHDPSVRAATVALMRELGLDRKTLRVDALRLRVHAGHAHLDPAATAAFTAHRDTWYGNPQAQLNLWIPLHEVDAQETFEIFPESLKSPVRNDSAAFDYDDFTRRVGWQGRSSAGAVAYPHALDEAEIAAAARGATVSIAGPAATLIAFSAAHLHRPLTHFGELSRLSVDLRVVDLDDVLRGAGPPATDRASRGSALIDYRSLAALSRVDAVESLSAVTGASPSPELKQEYDRLAGRDEPEPRIADLVARLQHWALVRPDCIALRGPVLPLSRALRDQARDPRGEDAGPSSPSGRRVWTWRELADHVASLALTLVTAANRRHAARSDGADTGVLAPRVGLVVTRSPAFVIALLACWSAGLAAVPIDPSQPRDRATQMLDLAQPFLLLHEELARDHWIWTVQIENIDLSTPSRDDATLAAPLACGPDQLAYLIFTSGSSGAPKGVAVGHRDLGALWEAQTHAFSMESEARVLWLLSCAFDASISDLGCAVWSGARLDVLDGAGALSAADVVDAMRELGTTHVDLPPRLLAAIDPESLPSCLRTIIVGGEVSDPGVLTRVAQRTRVVAVYGPTEATVCSHMAQVDPGTWQEPSIGTPRPGVIQRVVPHPAVTLSADGRDQGELWLSGPCLALGYVMSVAQGPSLAPDANVPSLEGTPWSRDAGMEDGLELRAPGARFVWDQGRRWYQTGDLVACRDDGALVFLGRVDRQLKLAGRLVAPEELEQVVGQALGRAVVVVPQAIARLAVSTPRGDLAPVELLLVIQGGPEEATALETRARVAMARALPSWMMPARILVLASLPRGASDKVDLVATKALVDALFDAGDNISSIAVEQAEQARERARDHLRSAPELSVHAQTNRDFADLPLARDELERALLSALCEVVQRTPRSRDTDWLSELALTSIDLIELIAHAEQRALPLTLDLIEEGRSLGGIAARLRAGFDAGSSQIEGANVVPQGAMTRALLDAHVERELTLLESKGSAQGHGFEAPATKDAALQSPRALGLTQREIFLTGATGFLGTHLLVSLLKRDTAALHRAVQTTPDPTGAAAGPNLATPPGATLEHRPLRVTCLVRAHDSNHGRTRLAQALARNGHQAQLALDTRIEVVVGDLADLAHASGSPASVDVRADRDFAESLAAIEHSAARADLIIHGAAQVNLTKSFTALADANLSGTRAVLELWRRSRASLLYISTLSVFVASDRCTGVFHEADRLDDTQHVFGGYAQTKWASERLVRRFATQHLATQHLVEQRRPSTDFEDSAVRASRAAATSASVTIARLGLLTGHSERGLAPPHDLLVLTSRGLRALGVYPSPVPEELAFDLSPVDVVADALAFLALSRAPVTRDQIETLHLAAPQGCPLSTLIGVVKEEIESDPSSSTFPRDGLRALDSAHWEAALSKEQNHSDPLERAAVYLALSRVASDPSLRQRHRALDLLQATNAVFSATQAAHALHGWNAAWPADPKSVLRRAVRSALRDR